MTARLSWLLKAAALAAFGWAMVLVYFPASNAEAQMGRAILAVLLLSVGGGFLLTDLICMLVKNRAKAFRTSYFWVWTVIFSLYLFPVIQSLWETYFRPIPSYTLTLEFRLPPVAAPTEIRLEIWEFGGSQGQSLTGELSADGAAMIYKTSTRVFGAEPQIILKLIPGETFSPAWLVKIGGPPTAAEFSSWLASGTWFDTNAMTFTASAAPPSPAAASLPKAEMRYRVSEYEVHYGE